MAGGFLKLIYVQGIILAPFSGGCLSQWITYHLQSNVQDEKLTLVLSVQCLTL
jgi:hypothetical protein